MKKIKVVILCGGRGYRLKEETEFKPKPMIEVGGKPILWHIMKIYAHWGFRDFIIALGYKGNLIKDYFINKKYYDGVFTLNTKTNKVKHHPKDENDNFKITFVDTGLESLTGERVRRLQKYIDGDFMLTYGDGLADINIAKLHKFHKSKNKIGTVCGVYPYLKYGGLEVDKNGLVSSFEKKAQIKHLINGGFMVFNKKVFGFIKPDWMIEDIFEPLIDIKQLAVYQHSGFFHAMDTYQDMEDLNSMWADDPPWKMWN